MKYRILLCFLLTFFLAGEAGAFELSLVKNLRSQHIYSPKSAVFSPDGSKFYVHALEGMKTLVFDAGTLALKTVIPHHFTKADADLFLNENTVFDYQYNNCFGSGDQNIFNGKPVECAFTHGGRYLWVSYYRRECDKNASSPSAIAVIDTKTDTIVRVLPSPPLPKMLVASPDGTRLAVTNWGDNTVALISVRGENPADFAYERQIVVGKRLSVRNISGNRDRNCGLCLRGTSFTPDGRFLLVCGMSSDILHVFNVESGKPLGYVRLPVVNPRHLVLNPEGNKLYVSFNIPGKVAEISLADILAAAPSHSSVRGRGRTVGRGARTVALSPDGRRLYVVCNLSSTLSCIDIASWKVIASVPVAPFGVGLCVSPDETMAVVTSQGRNGEGGNTVGVFAIRK